MGRQFRLTIVALGGLALLASTAAPAHAQSDPTVAEILDRALEQARKRRLHVLEVGYRFRIATRSERLGEDGEVEEEETERFEVFPIEGFGYRRLVAKNGQPLTDDELADERKHEREFREDIARGKNPLDEDGREVELDEELVSRYTFRLDDTETLDGRKTYVLAFEPKDGRLPVRRRIDRALNSARGRIWVNDERYDVARVQFELIRPVRIWWGILGSVSRLTGDLNFHPVGDTLWFLRRVQIYFKGRFLFRGVHRRVTSEFSGVTRIDPETP